MTHAAAKAPIVSHTLNNIQRKNVHSDLLPLFKTQFLSQRCSLFILYFTTLTLLGSQINPYPYRKSIRTVHLDWLYLKVTLSSPLRYYWPIMVLHIGHAELINIDCIPPLPNGPEAGEGIRVWGLGASQFTWARTHTFRLQSLPMGSHWFAQHVFEELAFLSKKRQTNTSIPENSKVFNNLKE